MLKILCLLIFCLSFDVYAKSLSLEMALQKIKQHPEVKNFDTTINQVETQFRGSLLNMAPSLIAERAWTGYSNSSSTTSPLEFERLSFQARLNLFNGFTDLGSARSSYFAMKSGEEQVSDEWREVQNQVAALYFQCFRDLKLLDVSRQAVEIRTELSEIAKIKYESGAVARDEYIKLRIDTQQALSDLAASEEQYESCLDELNYWVERPEELEEPQLMELVESVAKEKPVINEHPGWKARSMLVKEREWDVVSERGGYWPEFNVTFSKYPEKSYQDDEETVFFSIEWNFFDRGQTFTNHQLAKIAKRRAELELESYEKRIESNHQVGLERLQKDLKQYQINTENNDLAQGILKSSRERFEKGALSSNEVALDQSRVINAALSKWESWFDVHSSWLTILDAKGLSLEEQI